MLVFWATTKGRREPGHDGRVILRRRRRGGIRQHGRRGLFIFFLRRHCAMGTCFVMPGGGLCGRRIKNDVGFAVAARSSARSDRRGPRAFLRVKIFLKREGARP